MYGDHTHTHTYIAVNIKSVSNISIILYMNLYLEKLQHIKLVVKFIVSTQKIM